MIVGIPFYDCRLYQPGLDPARGSPCWSSSQQQLDLQHSQDFSSQQAPLLTHAHSLVVMVSSHSLDFQLDQPTPQVERQPLGASIGKSSATYFFNITMPRSARVLRCRETTDASTLQQSHKHIAFCDDSH